MIPQFVLKIKEESNMYNDEFDRFHSNQYHYGRNSNLPADDYQPSGSSVSPEERPRKKQSFFKSTAAKVIATSSFSITGLR